jgi:alpha-glucoside transport system substrate-binding protein
MLVLALMAAACGGDTAASDAGSASGTTSPDEIGSDSNGSGERPYEGTTVTLFGAFVDEAADNFTASIADFEARTGIDVQYEGSGDWVTLLTTRVGAGDPPDISFFPNPGALAQYAASGDLQPLPENVVDTVEGNYIDSWIDLGTVNDQLYGVAYAASVKSLVWYSPKDFADRGYAVPETWDELIALSDQIVQDGGTPWCIGLESGEASGWPGTDWVEDILLHQQGPEFYDQWVAHEVPFTDGRVKTAFETFGDTALNPDYVYGGTQGILTTSFGDAMTPMFAPNGSQCWLHRQASWYTQFLPDGLTIATDGDVWVFPFPPVNPQVGAPIMGGGDFAAAFTDRPEVMAVMDYLATPESGAVWASRGSYVSPHKDFDTSLYPEGIDRAAGEVMASADVFRFDGSDSMSQPASLAFLEGMVNYVNGTPVDEVLAEVDAAFDS